MPSVNVILTERVFDEICCSQERAIFAQSSDNEQPAELVEPIVEVWDMSRLWCLVLVPFVFALL